MAVSVSVRGLLLFRGRRRDGDVSELLLQLAGVQACPGRSPVHGCEFDVTLTRPVGHNADDVDQVALGIEARAFSSFIQ